MSAKNICKFNQLFENTADLAARMYGITADEMLQAIIGIALATLRLSDMSEDEILEYLRVRIPPKPTRIEVGPYLGRTRATDGKS